MRLDPSVIKLTEEEIRTLNWQRLSDDVLMSIVRLAIAVKNLDESPDKDRAINEVVKPMLVNLAEVVAMSRLCICKAEDGEEDGGVE
jgi:hypothetical protein